VKHPEVSSVKNGNTGGLQTKSQIPVFIRRKGEGLIKGIAQSNLPGKGKTRGGEESSRDKTIVFQPVKGKLRSAVVQPPPESVQRDFRMPVHMPENPEGARSLPGDPEETRQESIISRDHVIVQKKNPPPAGCLDSHVPGMGGPFPTA